MRGIDLAGSAALLAVLILIVFLSPNLSTYVALITVSKEASEKRRALSEQEKTRVAAMLHSVKRLAIEDDNLRKCIEREAKSRARIDPRGTGGRYQANELDSLSCPRMGIRSLRGIAKLADLRHLVLFENEIRDLRPLSTLQNLETLDLSDNRIVDISPLVGLPALAHLTLTDNPTIDVMPLARMTSLKDVSLPDLSNAYCADIEHLQSLEHIKRASSLGGIHCRGRMTRKLARILEKEPSEWSRKEEEQYLYYKINRSKQSVFESKEKTAGPRGK